LPETKTKMTGHDTFMGAKLFDKTLRWTLRTVAVLLFIMCATLVVLGAEELVKGWLVIIGMQEDALESVPSTIIITGLGLIVISIAVLDLLRSLLDEEVAERRMKNAQERARDFLTRFLAVIIFAIAAEIFVKLAQYDAKSPTGILSDIAMIGISIGAMLIGLAAYLKFTAPECKDLAKCRNYTPKELAEMGGN